MRKRFTGLTFTAVVALSPDSDFETTHKPLVTQPSVHAITRADLKHFQPANDA